VQRAERTATWFLREGELAAQGESAGPRTSCHGEDVRGPRRRLGGRKQRPEELLPAGTVTEGDGVRQPAPVPRAGIVRKVAATVAVAAGAAGLMVFATVGSFAGTDPFPHSVHAPGAATR